MCSPQELWTAVAKASYKASVRVADCPKCGRPARPAGDSVFCPACGWNRLAAAEDIRQNLLALPLVFLAFLAFSLLTKRRMGILVITGLVGLWIAWRGLQLILQKQELRRTELKRPTDSPAQLHHEQQDDGFVIPPRFSHFSSVATPRKLKMKPVFRSLVILLSIIGLAFTHASYSLLVPPYKAADDPHWGLRLGLIALAIWFALFWSWSLERRRKRLLRSGLVRFAVVLTSDAGKGALLPGITYKFLTERENPIEDFDYDWTDSYHQGMVVPVFYDPAVPNNHVAMCASFYNVV